MMPDGIITFSGLSQSQLLPHFLIKIRTKRKLEKELHELLILNLFGLTKRDKQSVIDGE